ncbi:MAG: Gfo/Idh/MocA family oxidoreductase [Candidatus Hydrogenedentes bacterium]|nr:Gfo/Idh/MocA family oxidoreductase [Candidatus Hydrogenedentota bacterium]
MSTIKIGIIMNGVTGRMGKNQHLERSLISIIKEGGVITKRGDRIIPEIILVGRNEQKLTELSEKYQGIPWTTNLDNALSDSNYQVYFDAQTTALRYESVMKAIDAGKHVYCEKPSADSLEKALNLYRKAEEKKVKHGVVQDKLWLPGILKLSKLIKQGFFGRIHEVRGEFGYWVFTGEFESAQRPSWNYKKSEGGGIIMDMLCHWRYLVDNLFGNITDISCIGATHIFQRWDESGKPYTCDVEDSAYSTFLTETGSVCHFNSSWCTRVRRDDLLTIQVDGIKGSAMAGLRECYIQPAEATPKPVWNPDIPQHLNFYEHWLKVPDTQEYENAFKAQWKKFLLHLVEDEPFPWNLLEGAKGVQLAELGYLSWHTRQWQKVSPLS